MFSRILIANRGEIACRVIDTARRLGVHTVAVYSDADREARHVALADEAYRLGRPPAAESYLDIDRVVGAALAAGAQAIHPGYGFLSENPDMVEACDRAGLVFIGPGAPAIRAMGLKDAAKRLMERAGVPVVPGYHGEACDDATLVAAAREIGFPVLVKAAAGGGGKGMRRVDDESGLRGALAGARREAASSFGNEHLIVERYLTRSRHIEVQVFADAHGNVVHLFERDCSMQRRHQKVIEEAPAPGMSAAMRERMGDAAVAACRAIDYRGAGTVEFIADVEAGLDPERFYFMEMNTRLQVEHPVTEMVTGVDLVEWQIRVAAGEPLPLDQDAVSISGHALEARVYAEDTARDFLPATGRLVHFSPPPASASVRVDTGVRRGDEITSHYDPLIAKLIVHGASREAALVELSGALDRFEIAGCVNNVSFLARLVANADFQDAVLDTGLIARHRDTLLVDPPVPGEVLIVATLHALGLLDAPRDADPWTTLKGWRLWSGARQFAHLVLGGEPIEVPATINSDGASVIELPDGPCEARLLNRDGARVVVDLAERIFSCSVIATPRGLHVVYRGCTHQIELADRSIEPDEDAGGLARVVAPLPGRVAAVEVAPGDRVAKGAPLVVLEAMKMELAVRAERDGVIGTVAVTAGEQVEEGALLVEFEEERAEQDASDVGGLAGTDPARA